MELAEETWEAMPVMTYSVEIFVQILVPYFVKVACSGFDEKVMEGGHEGKLLQYMMDFFLLQPKKSKLGQFMH